MHLNKSLLLIFFCLLSTPVIRAQEAVDSLFLWPEGAPGAMGQEEKDQPMLIRYPAPENIATGAAVVVCPGGGYNMLAMDHEGHQIARWLNSFGVSAYILTYRLGRNGYKHPIPMNDGKRAIRTVRANAADWNIDEERIGVLGFSAGGHMASTLGTHFDAGMEGASDPVDQESSRPDFMVLLYPVISFTEDYQHSGSRVSLLGEDADPATVRLLSNELQVTDDTPPAFLVHTTEDQSVPPENSIYFYLELKKRNIPVEMHIFEKGRHGLGMGAPGTAFSSWPGLCEEWMLERGYLND
ncbi:acetyl esterase/lipase [Catalinimonas alkaloidigena]|uniref:alpha/beta hydrolase n=1 Tax=Catalinimonas alkaloidigena TaxID=1075417 RepID=UPI0024072AB2|nr:alpha/beta hydrolase [Catalinimonas alkaloidigena]MDF9799656.1 acetyl esterase/lipase [Catalinimonas alkaloidigena]